jgi:hypothetical protein
VPPGRTGPPSSHGPLFAAPNVTLAPPSAGLYKEAAIQMAISTAATRSPASTASSTTRWSSIARCCEGSRAGSAAGLGQKDLAFNGELFDTLGESALFLGVNMDPRTVRGLLIPQAVKHKVFISYQHKEDQGYYDSFSRAFQDPYEILYDNSL